MTPELANSKITVCEVCEVCKNILLDENEVFYLYPKIQLPMSKGWKASVTLCKECYERMMRQKDK